MSRMINALKQIDRTSPVQDAKPLPEDDPAMGAMESLLGKSVLQKLEEADAAAQLAAIEEQAAAVPDDTSTQPTEASVGVRSTDIRSTTPRRVGELEHTDAAELNEPPSETLIPANTSIERSRLLTPRPLESDDARTAVPTQFEEQISQDLLNDQIGGEYRRLAQQVIDQSPHGLPTSQLFATVNDQWQAAETVARLGAALAELHCGDVLIVDADGDAKHLTERFEQEDQRGLTETLSDGTEWRRVIRETAWECMRFLPVGKTSITETKTTGRRFAQLARKLGREFRFTLVCGGTAEAALTQSVSRFCDVSYLLIQLGQTTASEANDAVAKLNRAGSRLLGCITLNSDTTEPDT